MRILCKPFDQREYRTKWLRELERKANTTRADLTAAAKRVKKETTSTNYMELYEKVSMECRLAVYHRSRECRAFNQKYRDTDFDITSDLQHGRNVYLSDLAGKKAPATPQSVRRVGEIFRKPSYVSDQSMYEFARGCEGTEWLIAAAGALSTKAGYIDRILIARDEQSGVSVLLGFLVSAYGLGLRRRLLSRWRLDLLHSR